MKILFFWLIVFFTVVIAEPEIPILKHRVTDFTGTLTSSQLDELEFRLKTYEDTTSNQIVVLIIGTLEDFPLEDYSIQVVEKNKIGQKGKNNGLLFLIIKEDRKMRIEVGYGLEGVVTDALASSIIRNIITPYFKSENYYEGISAAIKTLQDAIAGEYQAENEFDSTDSKLILFIFFLLLMFTILPLLRRASRGGWNYRNGRWNSGSRGGWGGFGGGFGGGGGFSGGFSGGGGSFGGGGASGRW
jgi:uncharacterized protein